MPYPPGPLIAFLEGARSLILVPLTTSTTTGTTQLGIPVQEMPQAEIGIGFSEVTRTTKVERLDEHVKKIRQERQRLAKTFVEQQPSSPVAVYALVTSFGAAPDPDLLAAALDALAPEWQQVHDARYLREEILAPAQKLRVGNLAPPIRMSAGRSDLIYSPEIMGRYVLIDFWASWCGPCRLANRQFVPIYQEFAPLGFTILGISLDRDTMAWHKAAMQDGVTWFDLCDGKGFGTRPAKDYGVKAVPFNVLVDPDGRILARDLKGHALRRWLTRELTSGLDQ